jgi:formate-dependent nitrite reductase membrane component NrfD
MTAKTFDIVGSEFKLGYRRQDAWGWKIAIAFFFGDVGAGTFFISAFYDYMPGMVLGWILTTFFKPAALLMHLGQPWRFWRAVTNLKSAWISRGVFGAILFGGFGFAHMVNVQYQILPSFLGALMFALAMVGCFIVMIYLGYVLSHSPALTLWNTGLLPIISLAYGIMGGVTMTILMGYNGFLAESPATLSFLKGIEVLMIAVIFVMLLSLLHGAAYHSDSGKASVMMLLKGEYSQYFIGYVMVVGLVATGLLAAFGPVQITILLLVAIAELIGDLGLKILLFKSAVYAPPVSHSRI